MSVDIMTILIWGAAMLGTGILAGLAAGLLGVGGGIVVVPVLFQILSIMEVDPAVRMHVAVGTSLAIIIPTSIMSARAHFGRGSVDVDLLKSWGPWLLVGVIVGSIVAGFVSGWVLTAVFAVVAILVAINMAVRGEGKEPIFKGGLPTGLGRAGIGGTIGTISTMMGIGGGTLSVPTLSAFGYPIRKAVGTAAAIGSIIAIPGTIGFIVGGWNAAGLPPLSVGYVNLLGFALIFPTTMVVAPWGAKIAHTISPAALRWAFAVFLGITSVRMFYDLATQFL
jgi:uncharacterized protein